MLREATGLLGSLSYTYFRMGEGVNMRLLIVPIGPGGVVGF